MQDEVHLVEEVLKSRIGDYHFKNNSHLNLANAFETLDNGKFHLSKEITKILENSTSHVKGKLNITSDEEKILRLIAEELNDQEIAEKLEISKKVVQNHRKNIYRKTKTSSVLGLLKFAYANNLI